MVLQWCDIWLETWILRNQTCVIECQSFPGRGNSECKGPEARLCWLSVWNRRKDFGARVSRKLVRFRKLEIGEGVGRICKSLLWIWINFMSKDKP